MASRNPKGFGIAVFWVAVVLIIAAAVGVISKAMGW